MASSLAQVAYLAGFPDFLNRIEAAMVTAAVAIGNEGTNAGTEYERLRQALATNVLQNRVHYADAFAWPVAANPVITADSSDNDLQYTVNSVWDAVAGAGIPPATQSA
ncbi:hypothetical protein [Kutzneria chonburiensis]|uniref:Uncharacterized protein n=1 Tax=Kutzneria chonburiensis TaxID=1483604 RepID=A0ABV6N2X0_9PSEU|nr:hypothetical protein [Kutzneria chonburiensis]